MAEKAYLEIFNIKVPLRLKREWRNTVRYSISKKSLNLTVPKFYTRSQIGEELHKIRSWAETQFDKNPDMKDRFIPVNYATGDVINIYEHKFRLEIYADDYRKGLSAEIDDNKVSIFTPSEIQLEDRNVLIGQLLSRLFSKHFLDDIKRRVYNINDTFFQEEIKDIRLKNNQSNWGSCSSNRNINLSSRLLFAPRKVVDYVITHELAHLKEMNHSEKFWSHVGSAMPDYKKYDSWLTKHGHKLRF